MHTRRSLLTMGVVVLAGFLVLEPYLYTYVIWPPLARRQAWQGTITQGRERQYGPYGMHTYHWRVQCDDGAVRWADVSYVLYVSVRPGTVVRKEQGERYPRPVGPPNGFTLLQSQRGQDLPQALRPLVPVERRPER